MLTIVIRQWIHRIIITIAQASYARSLFLFFLYCCSHYCFPQVLRKDCFSYEVITSDGNLMRRFCIFFGFYIFRSSHHEGTCADATHVKRYPIDDKANCRILQNIQMQCNNTITAVHVLQCIVIGTWLGIGIAVPSVGITIADGCRISSANLRIVDSQMKGHDTIATIGSSCSISISASLRVKGVVPQVRITGSYCLLCADGGVNS